MMSPVKSAAALALFALPHFVKAGAEGTIMGPVDFLWPDSRNWSASADNTAPCGSTAGVTFRTDYPLGEKGSVALTIADESYSIDVKIAYGNDPTSNDDFTSLVNDVAELEPGHQCYSIGSISTVAAGTNATLQLEYTGDDQGYNQTFYACADITFVDASAFTTSVPCFNVSVEDTSSSSTSASSVASATAASTSSSSSSDSSGGGDGLSSGAKAGIAIGSIIGASMIVGTGLYFGLRRRRASQSGSGILGNSPAAMKQTPSVHSGSTH